MNLSTETLPNDLESLKQLVLEQRGQLALQQAQLEQKSHYINQLIEAIALAKQQYFGSRSQKMDAGSSQLSRLFNEAEAIADHDEATSTQDDVRAKTDNRRSATCPRRSGDRRTLPDHFEHIEIARACR